MKAVDLSTVVAETTWHGQETEGAGAKDRDDEARGEMLGAIDDTRSGSGSRCLRSEGLSITDDL